MPRPPASTSRAKVSSDMAAMPASKGSRYRRSTPKGANARAICAGVIRRKGAAAGWNQRRGCGSKLTTASGTESSPAASAALAITAWWPRWTPSNAPMATAAPFRSEGRPRQSRTISTTAAASAGGGLAAARHADDGDAVHDQLAVDEALAVEAHPGRVLFDLDDGDADGHRVVDADGQVELQGLGDGDRARAGQDGADHRRAERGREQAVRDAAAVRGFRRERVVEVHRIEVVRGLGEAANALLGDLDHLLGGHADVQLLKDVAAGGMLLDQFDHGRPLS